MKRITLIILVLLSLNLWAKHPTLEDDGWSVDIPKSQLNNNFESDICTRYINSNGQICLENPKFDNNGEICFDNEISMDEFLEDNCDQVIDDQYPFVDQKTGRVYYE